MTIAPLFSMGSLNHFKRKPIQIAVSNGHLYNMRYGECFEQSIGLHMFYMASSPSYFMEEMEGLCLLVCGGGFDKSFLGRKLSMWRDILNSSNHLVKHFKDPFLGKEDGLEASKKIVAFYFDRYLVRTYVRIEGTCDAFKKPKS
jgi:hypothetical protein